MTGLILRLRQPLDGCWDARQLGGGLIGLSVAAAGRLRLQRLGSRETAAASELFQIDPATDDHGVTLVGDLSSLDGLASDWYSGRLVVQGDVGDRFAAGQRGGTIDLQGSAGNEAGQQLRGGRLQIHGAVGDDLAGPAPGRRSGMRGGTIIVHGAAGQAAGYRLRRGTIVLLGSAGDYCGGEMIAGTILLSAAAGGGLGHGMRRGTILVGRSIAIDRQRFPLGQTGPLAIAKLLAAEVQPYTARLAAALRGTLQRFWGDRLAGGQGEIWQSDFDLG